MGTFIVLLILIIIIVLAIRSIIHDHKSSCHGNCASCGGCSDMKDNLVQSYYQEKKKH